MTVWKSGRQREAFEAATRATYDDIGEPGTWGYGVAPCSALPPGFTPKPGHLEPGSPNYGNYVFADGSEMAWISRFWARIGHPGSPRYPLYGENAFDTQPMSAFASVNEAAAHGYFLPRAFRDAGKIQRGFFYDKFLCSNNGGIASSTRNGDPLSSAAAHNPFSGLNGAPANNYSGAFAAAKTRGEHFFPASRYMRAAAAFLSLAHGQAATSAAACAWYDAAGVTNFPKGCNNNALGDTNDPSIVYVSDGHDNCGKAGSASILAKTTHNGQESGIADLNGLMWEVEPGITCIATSKAIVGATQADPVVLTVPGHGFTSGKPVMVTGVEGMTQIKDRIFLADVLDENTIALRGVNGTAFDAYTSAGTATQGTFYTLKPSTAMEDLTGGNTLATDHFGATGVGSQFDPIGMEFATTYPNNGLGQRFGNAANGVLGGDLAGNDFLLAGLGFPIAGGMSGSGSNLFGSDYFYQYIRHELCLRSGASWFDGSNAGVWALNLNHARSNSSVAVGFRAACYPWHER